MISRCRSLVLTVLALILIGVGGYAYFNPAFAATCKSSFKTGASCVHNWADSAKGSLQKTKLYASVTRELGERTRKNYVQPKFKLSDIYTSVAKKLPKRVTQTSAQLSAAAAPQKTPPAVTQPQPSFQSAGQKIANGHAFEKHGRELGFAKKEQMALQIDRLISRSSHVRHLSRGRTAYWDEASGIVVIEDPNTCDGGTAFKPDRGRSYFEGLR